MSAGDYPFSTLTGTNLLDQIVAPKIVWGGPTGYVVQADLGNLDTIYSTNMGSTSNPINQIYATTVGRPQSKVSNLFVKTIGGTGSTGTSGARVSDIYVDTLHYLRLDPVVVGGTGSVIGYGNTGPTGPTGAIGVTGQGTTGNGISGTTLSNGNLIFTYTNGITANIGYVVGPSGISPSVFVNPQVNNPPYGTPPSVTNSGTQYNLNLTFSIPQGPPGPPGTPGGSGGTGVYSGVTGQVLYYGGSNGLTSSPNITTDGYTFYSGTSVVTNNGNLLRSTNDTVNNYIQSGNLSNGGIPLYITAPFQSNPTTVFDTQNNRVSINKVLDPVTADTQASLDVFGQTQITLPNSNATTSISATAYPAITTGLTGNVFLPSIAGVQYKVYGWGEGGTGPNSLAGGEVEFITTVGSPLNLNWSYLGGGSGAFSGGNALFLNINGSTGTAVAYGGGGGYTIANRSDPSAGQPGGSTASGSGGDQTISFTASPTTFNLPASTTVNSTFTNTTLTNIRNLVLKAGTVIKTSSPVINRGGILVLSGNTTCTILTTSSTLTADISLPPLLGVNGFFLNAGSTGTSSSITIPSSIVGVTATGPIYGNGLAALGPSTNTITGSSVFLSGVTGFSSQSITWSNLGIANGGTLGFTGGSGVLGFASNTFTESADAQTFTLVNDTIIILSAGAYIYAAGSVTSPVTIPSGSTGQLSVIGYGGHSYAGSGYGVQGGTGLNGGGGGGGFYGGGGGNNNIGGNGSSTGPTINNSNGIYPYTNKYNTGSFGGPKQKGLVVVETINTTAPIKPALIVNGALSITGVTGPSGYNINVPIGTNQLFQNVTASSLTTTGSATIAGPLIVGNTGFQVLSGNVIVNSGNMVVSGDIQAGGNVTAYSDKRIKENIEDIDSPLEKIMKLHGVYYRRKNNPLRQIGVIAQEVEEVLPEVVFTDESSNKNKSVAYGNIVALLIEGMKEQQKMIEELKMKHSDLSK